MILALAALGLSATIGQIVLMRELVAVFYGNELVLGLILAWWLLWEAVGAWGLGRWVDRKAWDRAAFASVLIVAALALPFQIIVTRLSRDLMGVTPGAFFPLGKMFWTIGLNVAPYCLLHGLGFRLGARLLGSGSAGRAYALESAGSVVGGALFSFLLINLFGSFQVILMVTTLSITAAIRLFPFVGRKTVRWVLFLVVGIVASLPLSATLDRATMSRQWPNLVFSGDSRYGRLTITALGGQRAFFENGLLAFDTESTSKEETIHFPLLLHPAPERVLLIGGGVGGDLEELFKHDIDEAVYLELDPLVIRAARTHLPPAQAAVLNDPRLTLIYQDGRRYTKHERETFDVIIVDLAEPSTGQLNRFYTLEFFQEVRAILDDGGVFSFGLPSAENYWNPELARRNASVYRTLREVFPTVLVTPGDRNTFMATSALSLPTPIMMGRRLLQRDVVTRWVTPAYIEFVLTGDRSQAVLANLEGTENVTLNQDLTPICYFYDLALWVSRFGSRLRRLFETSSLLHLSWLALLLAIAVVFLWRRHRLIVPTVVSGTGFSGMTLQIVLLLSFQALHGYVYHQVGLLVTAFMAGLAAGAGTVSRQRPLVSGRWLSGIQGCLSAYAVVLALILPLGLPMPALAFPLFAAVAGALTGAVFPLAAALSSAAGRPASTDARRGTERAAETEVSASEAGRVAGLLYGADLLGGCAGAIAASAILVPVLGVVQTCLGVAMVAGAGTLLSIHAFRTSSC